MQNKAYSYEPIHTSEKATLLCLSLRVLVLVNIDICVHVGRCQQNSSSEHTFWFSIRVKQTMCSSSSAFDQESYHTHFSIQSIYSQVTIYV